MGRRRTVRWGPRTIDIDLLFYGDRTIETDTLVVPHPSLHEREFVLRPLCDIAPDFTHPVLGVTLRSLLETVRGGSGVRLFHHGRERL